MPKRLNSRHREKQFNGFFLRSSGLKILPVYRIDPKTGVKTLDCSRNGVERPLYAHLANAYPCSVRLGLVTTGRSYLKFVTADERSAFDVTKPLKFSKKETSLPSTEPLVKFGKEI